MLQFLIWVFIGIVAGFLGSKIVNKTGSGLIMDLVLGIVGAFVGGLLFSLVGLSSSGGIIYSIIVATIGAVVVLWAYHALVRRRA